MRANALDYARYIEEDHEQCQDAESINMVGGCIGPFARRYWQNGKHAIHNWMWIFFAAITTFFAMCAHMSSECPEITKHGYLQYMPAWHLHIDTLINDRLSYDGNGQRWTFHFTDYSFWTACAFVQVWVISILLVLEPDDNREPTKLPTVVAMFAAFSALIAALLAGSAFFEIHQRASLISLCLLFLGDCLLYRSAAKRLRALSMTRTGVSQGNHDEIYALHARARRMVLIIWGVDVPIVISFALIILYVDLHQHLETFSANTASHGHAEVAAEFFYYGATALQLFMANCAIIALSIVAEYQTYKSKMSIGEFFKWQFLFVKPSSYVSDLFTKTGE